MTDKLVKEVKYYSKLENNSVKCEVCPQYCVIEDGRIGLCQGRKNYQGRLIAENYGELCTLAVDPIEKKPMYHFYPGSSILSTGPNGCNLRCQFCQNWEISQGKVETRYMSPAELVSRAKKSNSIGIAYTYTEPLIWYEYLLDCCKEAQNAGLKNVLVSNGLINRAPFEELVIYIDGMNIDLKSMDADFYKKICKGQLEPVLTTIEVAAQHTMLEITNLLITDENDSEEDIEKLTDFIASVDDEIPVHFSRYAPRYRMKNAATAMDILTRARDIARKKLKYVYLGNVSTPESSNTYCPECNELLVKRSWYSTYVVNLNKDKCGKCGYRIKIVV